MKKIAVSDFKLTPEEMKELVTGAQKYLPPLADPADEERPFKQPLDEEPETGT